jgi:hypothetical protein
MLTCALGALRLAECAVHAAHDYLRLLCLPLQS